MKFDLMGIVFMIVAIALGQFLGGYLSGYLGSLGGGLAGTFVVGFLAYLIYTFLTKAKFGITNALIFTVLIYVANMAAGYVDGMIGLGGGILTLVMTGFLASLLWGWIGGRSARKSGALKL
jgi:uncharacterized membrane protein YfcA